MLLRLRNLGICLPIDLVAVLLFSFAGLAAHDGGFTPDALLRVSWPFVTALLIVLAGVTVAGRDPRRPLVGVVVWAFTAPAGIVLREQSGQSVAVPFMLVTAAVLALLIIGWRLIARPFLQRREKHLLPERH